MVIMLLSSVYHAIIIIVYKLGMDWFHDPHTEMTNEFTNLQSLKHHVEVSAYDVFGSCYDVIFFFTFLGEAVQQASPTTSPFQLDRSHG